MNRMPRALTDEEWDAVAAVPEVVQAFGLEDLMGDPSMFLKAYIYAVRFEFVSDGPGYVGPLYLITDSTSPGMPPISLIESGGNLQFTADY